MGIMGLEKKVVVLGTDLVKKESLLLPEEMMKENMLRCCSDCKATQTPLWRGGPAGPKSLCNACGIRYRKKGNPSLNWSNGPPKSRKKREKKCGMSSNNSTISSTTTSTNTVSAASASGPTTPETTRTTRSTSTAAKSSVGRDINESLKVRLVKLGKEVIVKGSPPAVEKKLRQYQRRWRREWGEVEQAAVCLLAMSCDSVY